VAAAGALAIAALVTTVAINLHDSRPAPVVNEASKPHDADLSTYLIPAPSDAQPLPGQPTTRELDEDAAVAATGDRNHLRRYKFVRGYDRRWLQPDGALVSVRLLQFRGTKNAAYYVRDILDLAKTGEKLEDSSVNGVPGGRLLRNTVPLSNSDAAYVTVSGASAGDIIILITIANDRPGSGDAARSLLADQYTRL
jgi:hypothetical protein